MSVLRIIKLLALLLATPLVIAQEIDMKIAQEYFDKGEYEKAVAYYEELFENPSVQPKIYSNYLESLFSLQDYNAAEKMNKQMLKSYPASGDYRVDKGIILMKSGELEKAEKYFEKMVKETENSVADFNQVANRFIFYELLDWAEHTLEYAAENNRNPVSYAYALSGIYIRMNEKEKLQNHLLNGLKNNFFDANYVQNTFQRIYEHKDYEGLEIQLIEMVQEEPENYDLNEMMVWLYYQKKDFYGALIQAKAFDRKNNMGGEKVMEVGEVSMKNKDFENAISAFEYITKTYPESQYNLPARKNLIYAKEEVVKSEFPIDTAKVKSLIDDYHYVLNIYGNSAQNAELYRRIANLYAFYLNEEDKAVQILETLIQVPRADHRLISQAKLDLGDIYLLKGEPWESTLLYSQVEKDNKDTPTGHEAKLKNARLSYYKGQFELAKAHLDILKMATSREIANDALDLSLLIQDNTGLDTSTDALMAFADAELLLFQHKIDEGIHALEAMLIKYPRHSLTDEIYWALAQTYIRIGEVEKALDPLLKIDEFYADDILADDAIMQLARLYEEKLGKPDLAQELYKTIIVDHSGSIYVDEARKRFRILRGDFQ